MANNTEQTRELKEQSLGDSYMDRFTTGTHDIASLNGYDCWYALQCDGDTTFTATHLNPDGTETTLASQARLEGVIINGKFTDLTITDGALLAYRRRS